VLRKWEFSSADDVERDSIARETNWVDQRSQTNNITIQSHYHLPLEWVEVAS
jgi:hypothetical protein